MTAADVAEFDLCGPLPEGVTVLEASAGTGKTYAIAALATRYVAEGIPLDQLLIVTFTRMATGELRDRVRHRLASTREALDAIAAGAAPGVYDEVVRLLASGTSAEVARRRDRIVRALAEFDAATITTIHSFCQEALGELGFAADLDRDHRFQEDVRDLAEEVVDDLYVRGFLTRPPHFRRAEAGRVALKAIDNPSAVLEPRAAGRSTYAGMRVGLATAARAELDRRKRAAALVTFDDLLLRLRDALEGPDGEAVAARLHRRYRIALVDEFQDTDPDQWAIMRRAFAATGTTLVLIGDPKQAVYSFRGADVFAYLDAARAADAHPTLRVNWRSDQRLLDAYDALFGAARLGHDEIVYRQVRAAAANRAPRLHGAPGAAPLRIRVVPRDAPTVRLTSGGTASPASARAYVARDLAADVVALLESGARIETRDSDGRAVGHTPVGPGDVAVLVRRNVQAREIKTALEAAGVPAVVAGGGSVFASESARDWLVLLQALERPELLARARAAALTAFLGWSAVRVAAAAEDAWDELQQRLHAWAGVMRRHGVAALTETITSSERVSVRLLEIVGGERRLTDLRHVGELLHAASADEQLGITALAAWLRRRIEAGDRDADADDRARRLESDAEAVQVLTVHRSKGLEFPIVYCPYLWDPIWIPNEPLPATFHDAANGGARTIDVALDEDNQDYRRHQRQDKEEQLGEELRLAYVALTRARHQAVVWWAGSWSSRNSALGRLVFERDADGNVPATGSFTPTDEAATDRFRQLAAAAAGAIAVERATVVDGVRWSPPQEPWTLLEAATFDRALDQRWRRTSFTTITAGAFEARVASELEEAPGADDAVEIPLLLPSPSGDDRATASAAVSLLSELPAGARIGTFVHSVLEATDFAASDLDGELTAHIGAALDRRRIDVGDPAALAGGLRAAIETPLGELAGGWRLRDLPRSARLDEMGFELPLVGGDAPTGELTLSAVAAVLRAHVAPDDPLAGYAERLSDPALRSHLRGYLAGAIDLVARRAEGVPYAIVDYKTNRLAAAGEALTPWHYRPAALAIEMQRSHYVLQALLYAVALHRYLRWRVEDHHPDRDRPLIVYAFLRGMAGSATPVLDGAPCGVFAWRPPEGLVPALSDVFEEGTAA
ncbi:UvrD-helicase domain-containing protein [Conexibacter woesei]|uniref:RecBCD enzyme subunit RecB n=1 Tax=Conexibacter woesei (strain DSM 14684 / CCUG 47730 / CIP 108061 / JCM 11494 / NBRC 100937 / ID131577) TaxID=469383 RepID=D3FF74_CONWI|nr:UvrD-helicase domain-containing protein [Conexibacter woesei]ADB51791.1 exodeoxyribonuclease V, beta subunit [Conexibacter woesei DSM 14684]